VTDKTRIFWRRVESFLRSYNKRWTPPEYLSFFRNRDGWFFLTRTVLFVCLVFLAAYYPHWPILLFAFALAAYLVLDALVINTAIAFVLGSPTNVLRSILRTFITYVDIALAFALGWLWLDPGCPSDVKARVLKAFYQSLRTISTSGPELEHSSWSTQILVIAELSIGLYFVVVILAICVSWADATTC